MTTIPNSARPLWSRLKDRLQQLNFFSDIEKQTAHDVRNQYLSTRIFLLLFTIALVLLVLYTSVEPISVTETVQRPTFSTYERLNAHYTQTLVCPCETIAIPYDNFVSFGPKYHQVCQSDFVSERWIEYLLRSLKWFPAGGPAFQVLATLCLLSQQIVKDELLIFYSTAFITDTLVSKLTFNQQVLALTNTFKDRTKTSFTTTLSSVKDLLQSNSLLTVLHTNYILAHADDDSASLVVFTCLYNGVCSCALSPLCVQEAGIYQNVNGRFQIIFNISNFYTGCYVVEALLQSSLAYFYNQTSMTELQSYLDLSNNSEKFNVTALDLSIPSNYAPTTTIGDLLNKLMIEDWNLQTSFESCFNACQPLLCTYTYSGHNGLIYVLTTTFGLIGGIATVLFFLVPLIVGIVRKNKNSGVIIVDNTAHIHLYIIPGFYMGCHTTESLLSSTLECFFDQSCLDAINTHVYNISEYPFDATVLNSSSKSQFTVNSTLRQIVQQLMIEEWNSEVSFDKYYNSCTPEECAYTYQKRTDLIYILTTITGLLGGLTTIFKLLIPPVVAFFRRKKDPGARERESLHAERLYVGCYIVDALLHSDLRCFYDQSCLSTLLNATQYPSDNITSLNASVTSQYTITTSIDQLVRNLLIEQWNDQTSYESYFDACQSRFCTYSYISSATLIYIITTIIGLIGGLTKVFKFIIPLAVRIVRRYMWSSIKQKLSWLDIQNNTVVPFPSASTNAIDNDRLTTIS
ncbi:unnamed protein product [Didymodactylos carnosus]|uniref:Uncharacterized protein n=1 Tax=Didymodactylos carnosus TaxID=1234261 RepID=A0A814WAZ0_9BILA|nr:unnamed protein product [Didymodactylos carnosus]CAF1198869.1 unnamed protein product [Didymodactylos carnosus]CAF3923294.1 unnamed protein product [Didymodactylos carnosus]CAF3963497.1 unnamed protein product [Didymodactylos carnosus]